jgi:RNA polymerase sigma factor (sigma-70 family)
MNPVELRTLIVEVQLKKPGAADTLLRRLEPQLKAMAGGAYDEREDQMSAARVAIWGAAQWVELSLVDDVAAYLYTTARNAMAGVRRLKMRDQALTDAVRESLPRKEKPMTPSPEEAFFKKEREAHLRSVIRALPEKLRPVVIGRLAGKRQAEVAAGLGQHVRTVRRQEKEAVRYYLKLVRGE